MTNWVYLTYTSVLFTSAIISLMLAFYVWRWRGLPGAPSFAALTLSAAWWALSYAYCILSHTMSAKLFWLSMRQIGLALVPVSWLTFVLYHLGRKKWLTGRRIALLLIIPILTIAFAWTNEHHHLMWQSVSLKSLGPVSVLVLEYGIWFWVMVFYSYMVLLVSVYLIAKWVFLPGDPHYPRRAMLLVLTVAIPWAVNALYVFFPDLFSHLDPTPAALLFAVAMFIWGLSSSQVFDILLLARNAVVDWMSDGVVLLDADDRVQDLNPVAQELLRFDLKEAAGLPCDEVLPAWKEWLEQGVRGAKEFHAEVSLGSEDGRRLCDVRVSPLYGRRKRRVIGHLLVLRDVTDQKRTEEMLRRRERFLRCVAEISQLLLKEGNLSRSLPRVLQHIGETAEVCRVALFENHSGPAGELVCSLRYEWRAEGVLSLMTLPEATNFDYVANGVGDWMETLSHGEMVICHADERCKGKQGLLGEHGIRSVLLIPLFVFDSWYGFIGLHICDREREWLPAEIDLLRVAASDIASSIERDLSRQRDQAMTEAVAAITSTLDFEQILDRILEQVSRVVPNDAANVMLVEDDVARIVRWRGYDRFGVEDFVARLVLPLDKTPNLRRMVETKEPMVIPDTFAYEDWVRIPVQDWLRSYASAPIVVRDEVVGFLNVDSAIPEFFSRDYLGPLRTFAGYAAAAIENARLYEQAHRRMESLITLHRISQVLVSSLDVDEVLRQIVKLTGSVVNADYTNVLLLDESGEPQTGAEDMRGLEPIPGRARQKGITRYVLETKQPVIIDDITPDGQISPPLAWPDGELVEANQALRETQVRSIVAVPIRAKGDTLGVLFVHSRRPAAFREQVPLLTIFANQAAIAIENARLFDSLRRRVAELEAIRRASLVLASSLDLQTVLEVILDNTFVLLDDVYDAHIFLYQDEQLTFGAAMWADGNGELWLQPRPNGLTYTVARSGETVVVPDMRAHPLFADAPADWRGAIIGLPLKIGRRVVGVMNVAYRQPRTFSEAELDALRSLADQAAIAIENARLFQAEQRQTRRLALLADIARLIATTLDADEMLQKAAESIRHHFAYQMVMFFLLNEERTTLQLRGYAGDAHADVADKSLTTPGKYTQSVDVGIIGHTVRSGQVYYSPDTTQDPHFLPVDAGVRSELCIPIVDEGQVIGALDVESNRLNAFNEYDISLLEAVADTVATGLRNIRLYEETRSRVQELTFLNNISARLGESRDVDEMINAVLRGVYELLGLDRAFFVTADMDTFTWQVSHGKLSPEMESVIGLQMTFNDVPSEAETLSAGEPFISSDVEADRRLEVSREIYRRLEIQSLMLMPVQVKQRLRGVLGVAMCCRKHSWKPDEVRLLEGVAHQLELAIENATLIEEAYRRNKELEEALARQEELDRLKDEFIQNVSHELRTPLALILGYAEMLDKGDLGELQPVQRKPVEIIARRARMLSSLVEDITLILEAEASPPTPKPIPLERLALDAVDDFQVAAERAGLTLRAEVEPGLPPVKCVPTYLRRVLDNLLGNAAKFTPEGGSITLRVWREGEYVALAVSDTGVGIPSEKLERIFERFYQVDGSARRKYGGVGLGLALVKEIAETYGGRVTVESEVGKGSTFTVWLPIFGERVADK